MTRIEFRVVCKQDSHIGIRNHLLFKEGPGYDWPRKAAKRSRPRQLIKQISAWKLLIKLVAKSPKAEFVP